MNEAHLHLIRGGLNYNMELLWEALPGACRRPCELKDQPRAPTPTSQWVRVVAAETEFQFRRRMPKLDEINAAAPRHAGVRYSTSMTGRSESGRPYGPSDTRETPPDALRWRSSGQQGTRRACDRPAERRLL